MIRQSEAFLNGNSLNFLHFKLAKKSRVVDWNVIKAKKNAWKLILVFRFFLIPG